MRVECEGGIAALLAGTPAVQSVQGHRLPPPQELQSYQSPFSWWSEGLFGQSFSLAQPIQALRGIPYLGSFSVVQVSQAHRGVPWLGSYLVGLRIRHLKGRPGRGPTLVQGIRHLMGQPLCCSAANASVCGERGYGDGCTPYAWLSSIALLPWLPSSPPQAFSHHSLLPHIPMIHLSAVNSSPRPGIAPQSLISSSQPLPLPGDPRSCPTYVWLWQGLFYSHSI